MTTNALSTVSVTLGQNSNRHFFRISPDTCNFSFTLTLTFVSLDDERFTLAETLV